MAGAVLAVALLAALLVPTYPNYDSYFALNWGRELLHGHSPSFQAYAAPTEHPLWVAWCALLDALFGGVADRALVVGDVVALVALVWAVLRTARACFGPLAGVVAALCCGSSFAFLLYAARGYVDVPFLAMVLWAAALEAERPERGLPVLTILAFAGLLRPEAWVLAGAYWLWLAWHEANQAEDGADRPSRGRSARLAARENQAEDGADRPSRGRSAWLPARGAVGSRPASRERVGTPRAISSQGIRAALGKPGMRAALALVLAPPLIWFATDLAVTGDPLFSLHSTSALADALGRERGLRHVPTSLVSFLSDTARPPVFAAGLIGLWLAWRRRADLHALHVPYALFGAGLVTFVATGVAGLSILPRYLTVPAVALCLFAGYVVGGFEALPAGTLKLWWTRGAVAAVAVGVVFVGLKLGSFRALRTELRFIHATHVAVVDTVHDPRICRPLTLPTYRLVPDLRFEIGGARFDRAVIARSDPRYRPDGLPGIASGVYLIATDADLYLVGHKAVGRFGHADGVSRATNVPPLEPGLALHGMLVAYGCAPIGG